MLYKNTTVQNGNHNLIVPVFFLPSLRSMCYIIGSGATLAVILVKLLIATELQLSCITKFVISQTYILGPNRAAYGVYRVFQILS